MAAFCRHYGCHTTPAIGFGNWNESIISESRRVTSREWGQIELQYETALQSLGTSLRAYLNELSPTIQDFEGSECFIESLDNHIGELREALEHADKGAVESLSKIKFDATQTHLSSYLLTEMIPTYRLAIQDHGNGVTQRRITTLVGRLQQGDIFHRIRQRIMHNLDLLARAMTESLERRIGGIFADVRGDLNALNGSEAAALKREPAFRVLLVRKLTEWQREVDGFQSSSSEETSIPERTRSSRGH
ncbi:MAG: hypothetical protein M1825_005226 [Sarcosagium campestre]|nr:MAG: hypothetical protein M1825_005226 [Sarcosagium campestre]